ncbi:M28 family peptidase [Solirubrobacter sp. CPCC 204708]|uniref:M28 family peptidase n=1 Tax=Solirubrobacter deserti TaxID=2282478 RepID=A0ABT4RD97_9ACTN|nr:M28 family peptidase [Solirubrobacter deserti]MBE2317715.1 M28 family peptidase [Solirubrobacter deserti]MDA0136508.1 M28 family peptidase [Solirubrobacter deserti]
MSWKGGAHLDVLQDMNLTTIGRCAALAAALALSAAPAQADVAYEEMRACAQLGAKPPGSAAGHEQARRLERGFHAAGFTTARERFHVPLFQEERTQLTVAGASVPAESFAYGGTGRVRAGIVDVGVGRSADYAGKDVTGKIVLVDRDEAFHRTSQLAQVIARGGAAMLYVSGSPDNLIQEGTVRFAQLPPAPVPAVSVGAQDGAALRATLAANPGAEVALEVEASREDAVAANVIGVRRGTTHPGKVIVVGAHYDSWHAGAIDNCTGVGSLLSIADAVRGVPLAYTVVLAGWDAEEVGLTGSYDWVARHADRLGDVVANINLEMTAAETGAPALRFGTSAPKLTQVVQQAAAANGYVATDLPATVVRQISGGILPTDIQPFYSAGVQGFSTFTSTPFYHTPQDVPERVDAASLSRASAYLWDALLGLQSVAPEELAVRDVPSVTVRAPERAEAGAELAVEVELRSPTGAPVLGAPVRVLVDQNDHWARHEGVATELGGGRYRFVVPAGATDAGEARITATADTPAFIAEGYAAVELGGGVLLRRPDACDGARWFVEPVRGHVVEATVSAGKVRVVAGRLLLVDARAAGRDPVVLRVRARVGGRELVQSREYRVCAR